MTKRMESVKGCTCAELSQRYIIQRPSYGHFSECAALLASATPPVKVPHVHEPGGAVCHGSGLGCGVLPRPASKGLGGKSPALAVRCTVCGSQVGVYCMKPNGGRQTIAHKKRRELAERSLP